MLYCIGAGKKLTKETCLRFLLPVLCVCVFCFCLFAFFPFFYIERGAQHFLTNNKIHGLSSIKSKTNLYFKIFFIYIYRRNQNHKLRNIRFSLRTYLVCCKGKCNTFSMHRTLHVALVARNGAEYIFGMLHITLLQRDN